MGGESKASGPDFGDVGLLAGELREGAAVLGQVGGESVVLTRCGGEVFATGASCTHYGGPLAEGLVRDGTIRCPWHHARFDLRSGEAVGPPGLGAIPCYRVEERGDRLFVIGRKPDHAGPGGNPVHTVEKAPTSVVIVGAGPAGAVTAEALRREGFEGSITLLSADADDPVDRPNLSKDYLAGNAPEDWIPLRGDDFYAQHRITHRRSARVVAIDPKERNVTLEGGEKVSWEALVLATGATPNRLPIPGAELPHVHLLRTFADSRRIIDAVHTSKRAVVIGASFIGLEVAASLRTRGLEVHVVGPENVPLERVLGPTMGMVVRDVHEKKGEVFHLGRKPVKIEKEHVALDDGTRIPADLVVIGVGVRPDVSLAEAAGLAIDRGVVVDAELRASLPGIWAIGDIARFPDARTGERIRVEHWVVAEQHALAVAKNIVGRAAPFSRTPFFWSAHHDLVINYVGHAEQWDRIDVAGDPFAHDCAVAYRNKGRTLAVATIGRDLDCLRAEAALEANDEAALRKLIPE